MSNIKQLIENLNQIENTVTEGKTIGHDYRFNRHLSDTEPVKRQKPGVPATKKQTDELFGDGATEESVQLDEDMVEKLAREFAEFLQKKEVVDEVIAAPATQPAAAPAQSQAAAQPAAEQPKLNPIAAQLSKLLGMQSASQLVAAYKAPKPTTQQLAILAQAFKQLAAADPQTTTKAMMLLKKISAEDTTG
jgi:Asp-tRNA(Asn)/Glu-tRNA(Gln) amidotransferase C subunit